MGMPYDMFIGAFLSKITEFEFINLESETLDELTTMYLKRAVSEFRKNCKYDLFSTQDDTNRQFNVDVNDNDVDELVNIISEGMLVQWMKPYVYRQENLENVLNTNCVPLCSNAY